MALVDLVMPKMGESIMEATILRWNKQTGDTVKMDETVLEIATDKVDSEVPSTAEGVLEEILFNVNDVVPVGTVIARIRSAVSAAASAPSATVQAPAQRNPHIQTTNVVEEVPYQPAGANIPRPAGGVRFYSPLVLNIAAQEGVNMSELEQIAGTGNEGRVTKKDILQYVSQKRSKGTTAPAEELRVIQPVSRVLLQKLLQFLLMGKTKSSKWIVCVR